MKTLNLDAEEQELLDAFEAGEFKSVMTSERKQFIETVAKQSFQQNKRVNIKFLKAISPPFKKLRCNKAYRIKHLFLAFCTSMFQEHFMKLDKKSIFS